MAWHCWISAASSCSTAGSSAAAPPTPWATARTLASEVPGAADPRSRRASSSRSLANACTSSTLAPLTSGTLWSTAVTADGRASMREACPSARTRSHSSSGGTCAASSSSVLRPRSSLAPGNHPKLARCQGCKQTQRERERGGDGVPHRRSLASATALSARSTATAADADVSCPSASRRCASDAAAAAALAYRNWSERSASTCTCRETSLLTVARLRCTELGGTPGEW
mmetsp:Transcript_52520/g.167020  ORF Transcript_52520/g.167020 Transcript_52520/m.167020 type:complete len:228 (+) Transcript_52520:401-1084(+)